MNYARRSWLPAAVPAAVLVFSAFAALSAGAAPPREAPTPYGAVRLEDRPNLDRYADLGRGSVYGLVAQHALDRSWFRFGGRWPGREVFWPAGQTIAVRLRDGRVLEALEVLAVTPRDGSPPAAGIALGGLQGKTLQTAGLEQGRSGRGCLLLVSFSDPNLGLGDVMGVQVRHRETPRSAAPAPAIGGPR